LQEACGRWGIVNDRDVARFLAQLSVESAGCKHVSELTGYRASTLLRVFKGRNGLATLAEAEMLVADGPRAVFNFIYGGPWGQQHLGNTEPDDGWNFRGRGLIQTTGRTNYRDTSIGCYGNKSLLDDPALLESPQGAAESAAWYWYSRRLNGVDDVADVTRAINAGMHQLRERREATTKAYKILDSLA
jgi:putative chitinase